MTDSIDDPCDDLWFAIERELRDDASGQARDRLKQRLATSAGDFKRQLDLGVAPAEFATLDRIRQGLDAAIEVVDEVWRRYHPAA